ncbi:MAG: leucyl/phenylalanyl-tRNA--protein transferase, partial [Bauldia sp.]
MSVSESIETLCTSGAREHLSPVAAVRRAALFRETLTETAERWALGTAYTLQPHRITGVPGLARTWLADLVTRRPGLPDPAKALAKPDGLAGIVHDFSSETILEAYRRTLYPHAHCGPLKWWSPAERCVLHFDEFHIAKRLRRQLRQQRHRVTFDRDFERVIKACAGRRDGKWHLTWITPKVMRAYARLFDEGYAHSFEVWDEKDQLVGGGYGLAVGRVFSTESQFSLEPNTSKIGFTVLNWHLARWSFSLNDGKAPTPTIDGMGFRSIPRGDFAAHVEDDGAVHPGP